MTCSGFSLSSLPVTDFRVFIFGGQSNMAGIDALIDPASKTKDLHSLGMQTDPDRNTLFTFGALSDTSPVYPWGDVRGHAGKDEFGNTVIDGDTVKNIGPEVGFTRQLHANGWANVAIIKVFSNFASYEDGRSPWLPPNSLWTEWHTFVTNRLSELTNAGHTYTIEGFVWHQGIDDAIQNRSESDYKADLTNLISSLRSEYGTPETPFVLACSVNSLLAGVKRMIPIRTAQVAVAEADPKAAWISVDDLDNVNIHHLTAPAHLIAGKRFGEAFLRVRSRAATKLNNLL